MKLTDEEFDELYESIFSITTDFYDDPNGPYESFCPMCDEGKSWKRNENKPGMSDINHAPDCPRTIMRKIINPEYFI